MSEARPEERVTQRKGSLAELADKKAFAILSYRRALQYLTSLGKITAQ